MQKREERVKLISIQVQIFHKEGEQLENYTKYKLKSSDELTSVLSGRDNLFVIACNKCFKEFETVDEADCEEFLKLRKSREKLSQAVRNSIFCVTRCTQKEVTGSAAGRYRECSCDLLWSWYPDCCGSGRQAGDRSK